METIHILGLLPRRYEMMIFADDSILYYITRTLTPNLTIS